MFSYPFPIKTSSDYGQNLSQTLKEWDLSWKYHSGQDWQRLSTLPYPAFLVATGGTTSIALLIANRGLYVWRKTFLFLFPYEYLEKGHGDLPLLCISYSGETPDIEAALAYGKKEKTRIRWLITGNANTSFLPYLTEKGLFPISEKRKDTSLNVSLRYLGQKQDLNHLLQKT